MAPASVARTRFLAAEDAAWHQQGLDRTTHWIDLPSAGRRVRVTEHGTGPPLLLLHGITGCSTTWLPLLPHLAGFRCLLVDFLAHGPSDDHDFSGLGPPELRAFVVDVLRDILDAFRIDRAALIGHSMGGMFALWLAATDPDRCEAVVVVGEPGAAIPGARAAFPFWLLSTPVVNRTLLAHPPPLPLQLAVGRARGDIADPPAEQRAAAEYWANRQPGRADAIAGLARSIVRTRRVRPGGELADHEIEQWTVPTIFIWGDHAPLLRPDGARPTIDRMPHAELVVVPGGHTPWTEDPPARAKLVTDFLHRHLAPDP